MILSGKDLSDKLKALMAQEVATFPQKYGRVPHLAVVLVGDDPASASYVRSKAKASELIGIRNTTVKLPEQTTQQELLDIIDGLNKTDDVDGILVQLPLPKHIDENKVIETIALEKDVDGFHPGNVSSLWLGEPCIKPCTPKGIMEMIASTGVKPSGKTAVVVGRSNIVGKPVAKLLLDANATVVMAHSRTADLPSVTRQADILVVAVGRPGMVDGSMVKPGAVVIDVGINRTAEGKLVGDVDFASAEKVAGWITPVPGGVGPMTITMLMRNTIECFLARMDR